MADSMLFIAWGAPVRGREERGLEVFNEAVGFYGRQQQEGRIEQFDAAILTPNGDLNGYMELKGTRDQIATLQADDEFRRILVDAALCVEGLRVCTGVCDDGIAAQMETYREAVSKVPQAA